MLKMKFFLMANLGNLSPLPNARLRSGNILLIAKRIELDQKQNEAVAIGNVILSDGRIPSAF
jgi:lipopolysaccharide export system protein LptA